MPVGGLHLAEGPLGKVLGLGSEERKGVSRKYNTPAGLRLPSRGRVDAHGYCGDSWWAAWAYLHLIQLRRELRNLCFRREGPVRGALEVLLDPLGEILQNFSLLLLAATQSIRPDPLPST